MINATFKKIQSVLDRHEKDTGVTLIREPGIYEFSCGALDVDIDMHKAPSCELRLSGKKDVFAIFWNTQMEEDKILHCVAMQLMIIEAFFSKKLVSVQYTKTSFLGVKRKASTYAIQADNGFTDLYGKAIVDVINTDPVQ